MGAAVCLDRVRGAHKCQARVYASMCGPFPVSPFPPNALVQEAKGMFRFKIFTLKNITSNVWTHA